MSLVAQIVFTTILGFAALIVLIVAVANDSERAAWIAFGLAIVAHASFLDARMRWREAHQYNATVRQIR
jgi:hypothetical protein